MVINRGKHCEHDCGKPWCRKFWKNKLRRKTDAGTENPKKPVAKLAISSGHGRFVHGAHGICNEVMEARRVTDEVAKQLRKMGFHIDVFHDDRSMTVAENLDAITKWHLDPVRIGSHLHLSIHFNAYRSTDGARGVECLYRNPEMQNDAGMMAQRVSYITALRNRGAKNRKNIRFLNAVDATPIRRALLLEVCFVDARADMVIYKNNFTGVVWGICDAIIQMHGTEEMKKQLDTGEI